MSAAKESGIQAIRTQIRAQGVLNEEAFNLRSCITYHHRALGGGCGNAYAGVSHAGGGEHSPACAHPYPDTDHSPATSSHQYSYADGASYGHGDHCANSHTCSGNADANAETDGEEDGHTHPNRNLCSSSSNCYDRAASDSHPGAHDAG
jgi:hypothetical protein